MAKLLTGWSTLRMKNISRFVKAKLAEKPNGIERELRLSRYGARRRHWTNGAPSAITFNQRESGWRKLPLPAAVSNSESSYCPKCCTACRNAPSS